MWVLTGDKPGGSPALLPQIMCCTWGADPFATGGPATVWHCPQEWDACHAQTTSSGRASSRNRVGTPSHPWRRTYPEVTSRSTLKGCPGAPLRPCIGTPTLTIF